MFEFEVEGLEMFGNVWKSVMDHGKVFFLTLILNCGQRLEKRKKELCLFGIGD